MLHTFSALALVVHVVGSPIDSVPLRREELMTALRSGGYTVLLRHARTDRSVQEAVGRVLPPRDSQRNLSDAGVADAALMGAVFRKYGIMFAEIISSPMYRAVETAELAAGEPTSVTMALRVLPQTREQAALVRAAPKAGTNRLLVTHHFVIETFVPGIRPGDIGESEAAVIRHTPGGEVELVGVIKLDDWQALANPGHTAARAEAASAPTATPSGGAGYAAPAQNAPTSALLPDTHAGHLAHDFIAAFNTGRTDVVRKFIEGSLLADPGRSTDERVQSHVKLFDDLGPLSVLSVDSSDAMRIVLSVSSRRGVVRLTVQSTDAQPMRASSITFAIAMPGQHR